MHSFKRWLRRVVEEPFFKIARFAAFKAPLTLLSATTLWAITRSGSDILYAAPLVSLLTQLTEFLVMRNLVFRNRNNGESFVLRQLVAFWLWAALLAAMEGLVMGYLDSRGTGFVLIYVTGHIPTFFLRFYGDQKIFSQKPPS